MPATRALQLGVRDSLFATVAITEIERHLIGAIQRPVVQDIDDVGARWGTVRGKKTIEIHRSTSSSISHATYIDLTRCIGSMKLRL